MVTVFCEDFDHAALWAAGRLRQRGVIVDVITGADLASAERWDHRLAAGRASIAIQLSDGRTVIGAETRGVLNRLSYLPAAWTTRIGGQDRDYALQEMYALYLSWLHALPGPVVNPPKPQGLCGNWRHPSSWMLLANKAGLSVPTYRQSNDDDPALAWQQRTAPAPLSAFAIGRHVVAPPAFPIALHEPCRRLAQSAGVTLLGIDFAPDMDGNWQFIGASVMPDLISGGEPLIDAITDTLAP